MTPTRMVPVHVKLSIDRSVEALDAVKEILSPTLHPLTEQERKEMVKPLLRFSEAARAMVLAAQKDAPGLARECGFDGKLILTALDNTEEIGPLIARMETLLRLAEDTRMVWLAQAYENAAPLYRMAQGGVSANPALQSVVEPFDQMFAERRKGLKAEKEE